jgi:dihydroneopterin aldolase/2-amino-4-hydroxy-6-hydroxymethyldihydropteridine diphosphokinase
MTDTIRLQGLRVRGRHGVLPAEQELGQLFVVDLTLALDLSAAAASDDVRDTVHYGELAERVAAIVGGEPVQLLERLAARIAAAVLEDRRVDTVEVTVHKPAAPIPVAFDDVSVTLRRDQASADSVRAVVALGSNLGNRRATLLSAISALSAAPGITVIARSPVLETPALTLTGIDRTKPAYLNQVVQVETDLRPVALLAELLRIESEHGRQRTERWGDRTLDLDLITYGDQQIALPELTVPHPRAAERTFVLAPWAALDPDAVLPGRGRVADLLARLDDGGTA